MPQLIRIDPLLAVASIAAALVLGGCERRTEPPPSPPAVAEAPAAPPPLPSPPLPPPPLGRSELLQALDAARSAYAAGQPDAAEPLAGRRFAVRQAFGCGQTPASRAEDGVARWAFGPKDEAIEISLVPADWAGALLTEDDTRWEAAEGFWLTRPWMRTGDCPAMREGSPAPQDAQAPPLPPQPRTDGLAAVFEREGSRLGRRDGKAFSFTLRDNVPSTPPQAGYRLVIEGRLSAFTSGRAIRCRSHGSDDRPVCIAAAEVDRVAFETSDGKLLREWRPA